MKFRLVARVLSLISLVISLCFTLPIAWSWLDESGDFWAFGASLSCGMTISAALYGLSYLGRLPLLTEGEAAYEELGIREALAVVGLSWVIATTVGALPFLFSGALTSYTDAFFEAMSGFTTTGSTVIEDLNLVSRAVLFWRSMTHWLGGMGIIVLSLAVLPFLGVGGMELYKAEVPGPTPEKLTPRVQQTALFLWEVYVLLTGLETILLMLGGMDLFDALNHAFGTVATGGFSTRNESVAYYQSPYIEWVITFFMFAAGVNFSLHFLFLTGGWRRAWRDEEFLLYAKFFLGSAGLVAAVLWLEGTFSAGRSMRAAAFQVASFMTTTGFVSENYILWPRFVQFLILLLAFAGGCAGSTGGGLKVVRLLVLGRCIGREVLSTLHPRAVTQTRVNGKVVSPKALNAVLAFFTLYVMIFVTSTLAVIAMGGNKLNTPTAISGVVASLSNLGPGLGSLGVPETYAWLPPAVKWIFCFCMLAGRLELYSVILLFFPATWRR
ncbi:MAG: TrkH family potassium uptake protein [Synergistaceae bacterium]|nr:TrkH family potassium uptake protein [Synergistaceae bacterium]